MKIRRLAFLLLALTLPASAHAAIIPLEATLDCSQADAGVGTCHLGGSGTGSATITLDTDTNLLSWNLSWSGLSAPTTLWFFHGPAFPHQSAGVQVNGGSISGTTSPAIGSVNITAQQAADLLNELWYISIKTVSFAGGEIRGQITVVPEPATALLVGGGLVGLALVRRKR